MMGFQRWRPLFRGRLPRLSALVLGLIAFAAIFADLIASDGPIVLLREGGVEILPAVTRSDDKFVVQPGDRAFWPLVRSGPSTVTPRAPLSTASPGHPLGTDAFGRDTLARLVHGARTALALGVTAAAAALLLGCAVGSLAGMLGGMWDGFLDRSTEVIGAFPTVVLIALIRAIEHRPSLTSLMLAVVLVRWTEAARLTRTLVLRALSEDWLTAARALGASPSGIVLRHIVPNVGAPLLVSFVFSVGAIVLTETSLSFLGLGAPAEVASWGEMLAETRWGAGPRLMVLPACALALTVGALHLVAESLRQALDPGSSSRNFLD